MLKLRWELLAFVFFFGAFFEALIGNIVGHVSSRHSLITDVAVMAYFLWSAKRNWRLNR